MATFGTRHKTRRFGTISRKSSFSFVNGKNDSCDGFLFLLNMFIKRCTYGVGFHRPPAPQKDCSQAWRLRWTVSFHHLCGIRRPRASADLLLLPHPLMDKYCAHGLAGLPTRDPWLLSVLLPVRRVSYWRPIKKPIMPKVADAASAVDVFRKSDSKNFVAFDQGWDIDLVHIELCKNSGEERPSPNECKPRYYCITAIRTAVRSDGPFGKIVACQAAPSVTFCHHWHQTHKTLTTPGNFQPPESHKSIFLAHKPHNRDGRSGLCPQGAFMKFRKPSDPHGVLDSWC